jgi:hypothetical protein
LTTNNTDPRLPSPCSPAQVVEPSRGPAQSHRAGFTDLRRGLISMAIGFATYYGARYFGAAALEALLLSTVGSALRLAYSARRTRTFDPIAGFLMAANGITLTVGMLSQSPVITMLGQHIPGVIFQVFVVVGLVRRRPITASLLAWLRPDWVEQHLGEHGWSAADIRSYHRRHKHLTLAVALAGFVHLIAAAVAIFTLRVDIARGALGMLSLATDIVILAIVIGGVGRFLRSHTGTAKSPTPADPEPAG